MGKVRITIYRVFLLILAVWVGGGVFDSIASHPAWMTDPVGWVRGASIQAGSTNPWPSTTVLMMLATVAGLIAFWRGGPAGGREARIILAILAVVLVATMAWFVPTLGVLFGPGAADLSDERIISLSRLWTGLNLVRIVILVGVLYYGLIILGRMAKGPSAKDER